MNQDLTKLAVFYRLCQGVLPFSQWIGLFANSDIVVPDRYISQAFTVWFPTMVDYVHKREERVKLESSLDHSDQAIIELIRLTKLLDYHYCSMLSLYSKPEQVFIVDRRLQNVHGVLHQMENGLLRIMYYNHLNGNIVVEKISQDAYHNYVRPFYQNNMALSEMDLRNRCVTSQEFIAFGKLFMEEMQIPQLMNKLGGRLGVTGENHIDRI